jgi:hypothetical protein
MQRGCGNARRLTGEGVTPRQFEGRRRVGRQASRVVPQYGEQMCGESRLLLVPIAMKVTTFANYLLFFIVVA